MGLFDFISAAANLADPVLNFLGITQTNDANKSIANHNNQTSMDLMRESNEFNRQERLSSQWFNAAMMREQMAYNTSERLASQQWNLEQWNRQNQYNSPAAQAERLRAAGLNPAAVINGDNGSVASVASTPSSASAASSSPASAVNPPVLQSPTLVNPFEHGMIRSMLEMQSMREDVKEKRIDNETRGAKNLQELENMRADLQQIVTNTNLSKEKRLNALRERKILDIQIASDMFRQRRQSIEAAHDDMSWFSTIRAMEDAHKMSQLNYELNSRFGVALKQAELSKLYTDIAEARQRIESMKVSNRYTEVQIRHEAYKQAETIQRVNGLSFDNDGKRLKSSRANHLMKTRDGDRIFRTIDTTTDWLFGSILGHISLR